MEASIKKMSAKSGFDSTDLLTRQVAKRLYSGLKRKLEIINPDEVVVLDFSGTEVVDPSFCDEFFGNLLTDVVDNARPFYIRLKNLSRAAEKNLQSIFATNKSGYPKGFVTDSLTIGSEYFIGFASSEEREVLEYLHVNQSAGVMDIAQGLGKAVDMTEKVLERLSQARLVRVDKGSDPIRYFKV